MLTIQFSHNMLAQSEKLLCLLERKNVGSRLAQSEGPFYPTNMEFLKAKLG